MDQRRPGRPPRAPGAVADDGRRRSFGSGEGVTVTGAPVELLLFLSGRRRAAVVEVTGPDGARAAMDEALGL